MWRTNNKNKRKQSMEEKHEWNLYKLLGYISPIVNKQEQIKLLNSFN